MPWWKCLSRFCVQADAVRRPAAVRHEKVDLQRLARIDTILVEIRYAFRCKEGVIDEKVPGEALRLFKASARISGLRERRIMVSPPSRFRIAAVAIVVRGQSAFTATLPRNSPASPSTTRLIPNFAIE